LIPNSIGISGSKGGTVKSFLFFSCGCNQEILLMSLKCIFRHLRIRRGGGLLPASVFLAALLGVMAASFAQPTSNEEAPPTLVITPAAEPEPALRYRFWPLPMEQKSVNAMGLLSRAQMMVMEAQATQGTGDQRAAVVENYDRWFGPWQPEYANQIKEYLNSYADALGEMDRAAVLMEVDYPLATDDMTIKKYVSLLLPEVQRNREIARLLALRAKVEMNEARWDDLQRSIRSLYRLADMVGRTNESLINRLVAYAVLGMTDGIVREASSIAGAPNFYWALAMVPESVFDVREVLIAEAFLMSRAMSSLSNLPKTPIGRERAEVLLLEMMNQLGEVVSSSGLIALRDEAATGLLGGVLVVALAEPARRYLREQSAWGAQADELSTAEVVLRATALDLERTTDKFVKWMLLPTSLRGSNLHRTEETLRGITNLKEMISPVSLMAGLLMPAAVAANTAGMRAIQAHYESATLQALRAHAAVHGELPTTLKEIELPAWPDPKAIQQDGLAAYGYRRISPTQAVFDRPSRYPGDRDFLLHIELKKDSR